MMFFNLKSLFLAAFYCTSSSMLLSQNAVISETTIPAIKPNLHQRIASIDQPKLYNETAGFNFYMSGYTQGNSVPSSFSNLFLFPGFIDSEVKNNAYDKLKTVNRFGAELTYGVDVILTPDSTWKANGQHFVVAYRSQSNLGSEFGPDAFRLVFGGNSSYAGKSATLDNTNLYAINYNVFELGYQVHHENSLMTFRLGAVKGNAFTSLDIEQSSLYTEIDGSYLDFGFNGDYVNSNRTSNQFRASPSMGVSISAEFIQSCREKWIFKESIQDLGFINWNNSTTTINRDTSFRFSGIDLGSILSVNDSTLLLGDSLQRRFLGDEVRQTYMEALPLRIQLEAIRLFRNNWLGSMGLTYRRIPGYTPLITGAVGKTFDSGRSIRLSLMYGGFGGFQTGLRVVAFSNQRHFLSFGTLFNEGFLMPKSRSGAGIQISYVHHL